METRLRPGRREWVPTLRSLAFDDAGGLGTVVVAGEDAGLVAEALLRAGGPPLAATGDAFAVASKAAPADAMDDLSDIPDGAADLVILRHAWDGITGLNSAVAEGRRILAAGGALVLAEWDLDRLLRSPARLYPDGFFYDMLPEVVPHLRPALAAPSDLAIELVRAGFPDVDGLDVDETAGEFADRTGYLSWMQQRGFRGDRHAGDERRAEAWEAFVAFVPRIAPIGPVRHHEPWRVVRGRR